MDARNWRYATAMAATDLGVSPGEIRGRHVGNNRYELSAGGKSVEYALWCTHGTCGWIGDVRPRAEFDFSCPRGELSVTTIDQGTVGVRGCGKQGTYVSRRGKWFLNATLTDDSVTSARPAP